MNKPVLAINDKPIKGLDTGSIEIDCKEVCGVGNNVATVTLNTLEIIEQEILSNLRLKFDRRNFHFNTITLLYKNKKVTSIEFPIK